MAPEQINESGEVDPRTDIYALGAVLYYMLCGARPFIGKSAAATIALQLRGEYLPLPRVHRRFSKLIARALALDPDARISSVVALWEAVELASLQPIPKPRGRRSKLTRWLPWVVVCVTTAAVAVGASLLLGAF